jgi:hypothetical protein
MRDVPIDTGVALPGKVQLRHRLEDIIKCVTPYIIHTSLIQDLS